MECKILNEHFLLKGRGSEKILVILAITLIVISTGLRIHMATSNGHALNDRVHLIELADNLYKGRGFVAEWILFPAFQWDSVVHPEEKKTSPLPICCILSL